MPKTLKKYDVTIRYTFESRVGVDALNEEVAKEVAMDALFDGVPWEESDIDVVDKLMSMDEAKPSSFYTEIEALNVMEASSV